MHLPWLGLGLSSNAQTADQPNPYRLISQHPQLFDYVEYSAPLDVEDAKAQATLFSTMLERRAEIPLVYHPVHLNLWGPEFESEERLSLCAEHVKAVGSPWVSNDVGWWHSNGNQFPGYLYLAPPLDAVAIEHCVHHAKHVQAAMPVPLLIENPVVMTARGSLHVLEFMQRVSTQSGCRLLIDLGHLLSHQLSRGLSLTEGLHDFPWERVAQLHLAGGALSHRGARGIYVDDHTQPVRDEVFSLLNHVLPLCTNLRALTFEGDGHADQLAVVTLQKLRKLIPHQSRPALEIEQPIAAKATLTSAAEKQCWQVFSDVHTATCLEDPLGATAELDYRLAVMAEQLDSEVPLSRLVFASNRSSLAAFAASDQFRELAEQQVRSPADAFLGWARRRSRDVNSPGAEMLLAFETWARTIKRKSDATGASTGIFPCDLTEVIHSARAIKRHFTARAPWTEAGFESDGLQTLIQLAERAPRVPWTVTLTSPGNTTQRHPELATSSGAP